MSIVIKIDGEDESKRLNHKDTSGVAKTIAESAEEVEARRQVLDKTAPSWENRGSDAKLPAHQRHEVNESPLAPKKHISEKIYYFPEEFNALRRELEDFWPAFFTHINPEFGFSPAWAMVHNGPQFIGLMNGALDMDVQLDTENIAATCKAYLNKLRAMRGVSPIV